MDCRKISLVVLLAMASLLPACETIRATQHLKYHDEYYVSSPCTKTFMFTRDFTDGSKISGTLTYEINSVDWPTPTPGTYKMAGAVTLDEDASFITRDAAWSAVFDEFVKAMSPAEVPKVFEEASSGLDGEVPSGADRPYIIHRERLTQLKLPITYHRRTPAAPFGVTLRGKSIQYAQNIASVWLSDFRDTLNFPKPDAALEVTSIRETEDGLMIDLREKVRNRTNQYFMHFQRTGGLQNCSAVLADGSTVKITRGS